MYDAYVAFLAAGLVFTACAPAASKSDWEPPRSNLCPEGQILNTGVVSPWCQEPHASAMGEACSQNDNCPKGATCNFGYPHGRCAVPESSKEGEACAGSYDCTKPLVCVGARARDGVGGVCAKDDTQTPRAR